MFDDTTLLFSPWFRIIVGKWMIGNNPAVSGGGDENSEKKKGWWDDLQVTMTTDTFCDYTTIHRFDPPVEHMGGGGDAGAMMEKEDWKVMAMEYGETKADGEMEGVVGDSS